MSNTICTSACLLCAMAFGPAGVGNFVTSEDPWARPLSDLRNPDLEVRRAAAEAIMKRAAIEGFGVRLPGTPRSKPDPDHAEAAGRHIAALVSTIGDKAEDVNVRRLLVRAIQLGRYGEKGLDAVPCLIKVLRDETDNADVRSWCATVLPDLSRSKEVGQAILTASRSLNSDVRCNAFQALGRLPLDASSLPPVVERALGDPVRAVRMAAIVIAGKLAIQQNDRRGLMVLLRAIKDQDETVRSVALALLQELGPRADEWKGESVELLKSRDPSTRAQAAVTLIQGTGEVDKCLSVLIEQLQSKDPASKKAASAALSMSGREAVAAVPALKQLLRDPDENVRVWAALALTSITRQADESLPVLVDGLSSSGEEARWQAASCLGQVVRRFPTEALPHLEKATTHPDGFARSIAVGLLAGIKPGSQKRLGVYRRALDDPDSRVRLAAIMALAAMGHEADPLQPRIREMIADPNEEVRTAAELAVRARRGAGK